VKRNVDIRVRCEVLKTPYSFVQRYKLPEEYFASIYLRTEAVHSFETYVHMTKLYDIISQKTTIFVDVLVCIHSQGTELLEIMAQTLCKRT
jgi:hypothetical protein